MPCRRSIPVVSGALLLSVSCQRPEPTPPPTIRLADLHRPTATRPAGPATKVPRTEWRFEGAPPRLEKNAATWGWSAFNGVAGLAVRNGRLVGRATSDLPILHLARSPGFEEHEALHGVEVRLRVSAGASVSVGLDGSKELDRDQALDFARHFTWAFTAPLVPGPLQTHTLRTQFSLVTGDSRNIFLKPTDVAGATFEIESVRLVTRREHLDEVPSGLGWQGLSEVYKETLVARAPEALRFEVTLPARPMLDLAVGTVEDAPVRFRVSRGAARRRVPGAAPADGDAAPPMGARSPRPLALGRTESDPGPRPGGGPAGSHRLLGRAHGPQPGRDARARRRPRDGAAAARRDPGLGGHAAA
jgi:hypothetical protein